MQAQIGANRIARRWLLRALLAIILLAAIAVFIRIYTLRGLVFPVRVTSASMAPALLGTHRAIPCRDCRFEILFAEEYPPPDDLATCPNCGCRENDADAAERRPGDRVTIDSLALAWRAPRRFEAIAFRDAAHDGQLTVKRVAGLPGETLSIREGELYVDGSLVRKTWDQQRAIRVLLYDDSFRTAPRWRPEEPTSQWRATDDGYSLAANAEGAFDWLSYRHFPCHPSPVGRLDESPVTDLDPFNQGLPRSNVSPMTDVSLAMTLESSAEGRIALAAIDGVDRFEWEFDFSRRRWRLRRNRETLTAGMLPSQVAAKFAREETIAVEFGLCDRQICLAIDGRSVVRRPYHASRPATPGLRTLLIGARGGSLKVSHLRVYRDVYYTGPADEPTWRRDGAHDDFDRNADGLTGALVVLGDNPPASIDSRHRLEGVRKSEIEGIVKKSE